MSSAKNIPWSLVGLGAHAERMARVIRGSRHGELWGVASRDRGHAEAFAKRFGAPYALGSLEELLDASPKGVVLIASPNNLHAAQSLRAIASGNDVLCEKPMTLTRAEAVAVRAAAKRRHARFGVGFHLRFHPFFQRAREIIASGKLGRLKLVEAHWSIGHLNEVKLPPLENPHRRWRENWNASGGGALMARGVHLFDLIRFVTGGEAASVTAEIDPRDPRAIDTTAVGIVRFDSFLATLATSRLIPFAEDRFVVYGSAGRLAIENAFSPEGRSSFEWMNGGKTIKKTVAGVDLYQKEVEAFNEWVRGKKSAIIATATDGLASAAFTEAFIRSAKRRKAQNIAYAA